MHKLGAEFLGTLFLVATVVGSGIMAEDLSGGNTGLALLANTIATGAILYVIISMFGPISGAHFNPVVSLVMLPVLPKARCAGRMRADISSPKSSAASWGRGLPISCLISIFCNIP